MKRILFILLIITANVTLAQAQNEDIALISETAKTHISGSDAKKCASLMKDAQWYFKRKEFGKAKEKLNAILAINPTDQQAKVLLAQCGENSNLYGESASREKNKLSFGLIIGLDMLSKHLGTHIGVTMRYGHYTDFFNATAGAELIFHQSKKDYEGIFRSYDDKITLGGQIIVPVMAKFNLLKCTEDTRLYAGAGAEFGLKLYSKDIKLTGIYNGATKGFINSNTTAGLIQVGVTGRHFDLGIYYRHYFNDLVNDFFKAYQENDRIGINAAYYF